MRDATGLGAVLAGILHAVQEAKHWGDVESARLADVYRRDAGLSAFSVPAFAITDVEIELHFAVVGIAENAKPADGIPEMSVSVGVDALKAIDPMHLQVLKFHLSPTPIRVTAVEKS